MCGTRAVFGRGGAMISGGALMCGDVAHLPVAELLVQFGGPVVSVRGAVLRVGGKLGGAYRRAACPVGVRLRCLRLVHRRPVPLANLFLQFFVPLGQLFRTLSCLEGTLFGLGATLPPSVVIGCHGRTLCQPTEVGSRSAGDGMPLRPGMILVAPPDRHLLVRGGQVQLSSGQRVNRHRPSIDVMFASAVRWAGAQVTAVAFPGRSTTVRSARP